MLLRFVMNNVDKKSDIFDLENWLLKKLLEV